MFDWYRQTMIFNSGEMSADELLKAAGDSRRNQVEAHFFIGIDYLSLRERELASMRFRNASLHR